MKAATVSPVLSTQLLAFQSTPPVKAATGLAAYADKIETISIHAAREGGDFSCFRVPSDAAISIHAAREGGDAGSG